MTFAIVLPFWGCAMNIVAYATLLLNSCMVQPGARAAQPTEPTAKCSASRIIEPRGIDRDCFSTLENKRSAVLTETAEHLKFRGGAARREQFN